MKDLQELAAQCRAELASIQILPWHKKSTFIIKKTSLSRGYYSTHCNILQLVGAIRRLYIPAAMDGQRGLGIDFTIMFAYNITINANYRRLL